MESRRKVPTLGKQRDEVIARLRDKLVSGELKPGQTFSESELSEEFGTSRTPVREAIAILAHEGLLEQIPQVGVVVKKLDRAEVEQLLRFRIAVEQLVAEELCERRPPEGLAHLADLLDRMAAAAGREDKLAFLDYDTEFHCYAAESVKFDLAATFLRNLRDRIRILGLDAIQHDTGMAEALAEHRLIFDAISAGQADSARKAVESHLMGTAARLGAPLPSR